MIGQYRERVRIEQDNSAAGDPDPDYTGTPLAADVPCKIISVSGEETFRGRQLDPSVNYVVEMWQMDGVTPDMRVAVTSGGVYVGNTLDIRWVKQIPYSNGKPAQTWLYCTELVSV